MMVFLPCLMWLALVTQEPVSDALRPHQGTWEVQQFIFDGHEADASVARSIRRIVREDHVLWERDGKSFAGTRIEVHPEAQPPSIDVIPDGGPSRGSRVLGIYRLEGDTLTLCMAAPGKPRPDVFEADAGSGRTFMVLRLLRNDP